MNRFVNKRYKVVLRIFPRRIREWLGFQQNDEELIKGK